MHLDEGARFDARLRRQIALRSLRKPIVLRTLHTLNASLTGGTSSVLCKSNQRPASATIEALGLRHIQSIRPSAMSTSEQPLFTQTVEPIPGDRDQPVHPWPVRQGRTGPKNLHVRQTPHSIIRVVPWQVPVAIEQQGPALLPEADKDLTATPSPIRSRPPPDSPLMPACGAARLQRPPVRPCSAPCTHGREGRPRSPDVMLGLTQ